MTEEQRRLTLHCHLLVWVYGFNDFGTLRDFMDKTPDSYQELACFLKDGTPPPSRDPLKRPATETIAMPPPSACFPPPGVERDVAADEQYLGLLRAEAAEITKAANMHQCTYTCHKHGHANSCR
ncbi:unnamed protein product [Ectocarpus fasciculatus]